MEAFLTIEFNGQRHISKVEIVDPRGGDVYLPVNAHAVLKALDDARSIKGPLELVVKVGEKVSP